MDSFIHDYRMQLRLAEQSMQLRLIAVEKQPVGLILRRNRVTHLAAMLVLLKELRDLADHDEQTWWENEEQVPF